MNLKFLLESIASDKEKPVTVSAGRLDPEKCRCGHMKKYHEINALGINVCRFKSCKRCKGFDLPKFVYTKKGDIK